MSVYESTSESFTRHRFTTANSSIGSGDLQEMLDAMHQKYAKVMGTSADADSIQCTGEDDGTITCSWETPAISVTPVIIK